MVEEQLSQEEAVELQKFLGGAEGAPYAEEKHNVHTFLNKVSISEDTTKTGFLREEEVGLPKHPVRTFKNLSLISSSIMDNPYFAEFFEKESEIVTASSLSRDAKLLSLAVIQRRQLEDVTKPKKENKGWFKKKDGGAAEPAAA
mgnify:CR=1 FL=1|jgi:hypothetical protein|tara:strand:- start:2411 stop:2842 length:432 start_codon:yes stop_codon:yes gene_type:complete